MSSLDKMKKLLQIQKSGHLAKITTRDDEVFVCRLHNPAEDEEDWAYDVITVETVPQHYTLECDFMTDIEELLPHSVLVPFLDNTRIAASA